MATRRTGQAIALAVLVAFPLAAAAADDNASDLEARIQLLNQRLQQQGQQLQQMRAHLQEMQADLATMRGKGEPTNAYTQAVTQQQGVPTANTRLVAAADTSQPSTENAQGVTGTSTGTIGEKPQPSRSEQAVQQQAQGTVFNQSFTLEPSFTYSRFDRRQIALSGFLALDAIFLGSISVQESKAAIYQFDLTGRWGVTPRLQLYTDVPFLYRRTEYFSGGAGTAASQLSEADVDSQAHVGDISVGAYYQLFRETPSHPNLVANLAVKIPTGIDPYGIKTVTPDPNNNNLKVPQELPTGNGVYSVFLGFSTLKTVDPIVMFANVGVFHNFVRSFDDISTTVGQTQPGDVDLRNAYQWGAGVALALNDRTAMTLSFSQLFQDSARIRYKGQDWQKIIGSDANSATLNIGLTYAKDDHTTFVTNLGVGMSPDAPDFQINFKMPYTF